MWAQIQEEMDLWELLGSVVITESWIPERRAENP